MLAVVLVCTALVILRHEQTGAEVLSTVVTPDGWIVWSTGRPNLS